MQTVNIHAAKTNLSKLVDAAAAGEEIVIARAGKPVAKLVRLENISEKKTRVLGILKGQLKVPDDYGTAFEQEIITLFEGNDADLT